MRGFANEAVVFYREFAITKHMQQDRLARRGKDADNINYEWFLNECVSSFYE